MLLSTVVSTILFGKLLDLANSIDPGAWQWLRPCRR